ncbi:MAG: Phosphate acyltransferase [Chlamydiae bacterium]|nr:Phosphate acyltransferase [Chlamydiota bacterium]
MKIALDLMGSETPTKTFKQALQKQSKHFILLGSKAVLKHFPTFEHIVTKSVVKMGDAPKDVLRHKQDSSMAIGLDLVKEKKAVAFISCGNTGAIAALSNSKLGKLKPFSRLGLLAHIPTKKKPLAIIDVGANLYYDAKTLFEYGKLAARFQKYLFQLKKPKIALLNIGHEATKGKQEQQKAYQLFSKKNAYFTFVGNIEGQDVFEGTIDVLVTDGFSGNIFLKTAEGVANFLQSQYKFDLPSLAYGAIICGVNGLVIKCHGKSKTQDLLGAFEKAKHLSAIF